MHVLCRLKLQPSNLLFDRSFERFKILAKLLQSIGSGNRFGCRCRHRFLRLYRFRFFVSCRFRVFVFQVSPSVVGFGRVYVPSVVGSILANERISCPAIAAIVSIRNTVNQFNGCASSLTLMILSTLRCPLSAHFALHVLLHDSEQKKCNKRHQYNGHPIGEVPA